MDERLGEMQITLNNLYRRIADMEQRIRDLEAKAIDSDRRMTGSIQGLDQVFTVTMLDDSEAYGGDMGRTEPIEMRDDLGLRDGDRVTIAYDGKVEHCKVVEMSGGAYSLEFDHGPFSDEEWSQMVSDACQNPTPRRSA